MTTTDSSFERLLTVSVPEALHGSLHSYAKRHGFPNLSSVIRYSLENIDSRRPVEAPSVSRQISFRIPDSLRDSLDKQAKKSGVSLGHLIRTSLEKLRAPSRQPDGREDRRKKRARQKSREAGEKGPQITHLPGKVCVPDNNQP